jgi:hypothetical protein
METRTAAILSLALSLGVGILVLLIACGVSSNWWPMLSLVVYVMLPIPMFFTTIQNDAEDVNMWEQFGFCTGGFILSAFFGIPIIVGHLGNLNILNRTTGNLTDELDSGVVAGWTIANVIMFAGILAFSYIAKAGDS